MTSLRRYLAVAVAATAVLAGTARAQDMAATGRDILNQHKDAVVTVQLVISQQFSIPGQGSRKQENRREITGTVIDPSGLTAVSLSEADPASLVRRMFGPGARDIQYESTVTDAKFLLADGTEVPAKIVLRDRDLDLAFVRPITPPANPMTAVDLTQTGEPQMLNDVVILSRLGRVAGRAYGAAIDRIQAIVERPRKFYVPVGADPSGGLGSPVYGMDGKLVGMTLLRSMEVEGSSGNDMQQGTIVIIVPASDIKEAAAQAPSVEEAAKQEAEQKPAEQPPAENAPAAPEAAPPAPAPEPGQPAPPAPAPAPEPGAPAPAPEPGAPAPVPTPEPGTSPTPPAPSQTSATP